MRRGWLNALAVTAAISFGACAAGSVEGDPVGVPLGGDAGGTTPQSNSGEGGTSGTPSGGDAAQPGSPTGDAAAPGANDGGDTPAGDSGGADSGGADSGGADSGAVAPVDSGGGGVAADCNKSSPNYSSEQGAWTAEGLLGTGTSCQSGPTACTASQCCFVPVLLGIPVRASALCVPL